jgi:hypothetical protein
MSTFFYMLILSRDEFPKFNQLKSEISVHKDFCPVILIFFHFNHQKIVHIF